MKTSIPFNDNYTIQVLKGAWLQYEDGNYLIPDFRDDCQERKAKFEAASNGTLLNCVEDTFAWPDSDKERFQIFSFES